MAVLILLDKFEPGPKLPPKSRKDSRSMVEDMINPFELRELKRRGMGSGGIYEIAVHRRNELGKRNY